MKEKLHYSFMRHFIIGIELYFVRCGIEYLHQGCLNVKYFGRKTSLLSQQTFCNENTFIIYRYSYPEKKHEKFF